MEFACGGFNHRNGALNSVGFVERLRNLLKKVENEKVMKRKRVVSMRSVRVNIARMLKISASHIEMQMCKNDPIPINVSGIQIARWRFDME